MNRKKILAFALALTVLTVTFIYNTPLTVCQSVTPLFSVKEVILDQDHPFQEWVYKLQGRVTKNGQMSASVWSLRSARVKRAMIILILLGYVSLFLWGLMIRYS